MLLDSFGTLVSMDRPAPRLAAALGIALERAEAAFRAEIAYYVEHHVEGRDARSLDELRDRCAEVMRHQIGDPDLDLTTVRVAMLDSIRFRAYPDVAPALRSLRAGGLRLVVASNWDCSLPQVLEDAGLRPLLDGVVSSASVGADKPAPALFEAALRVAGCPAEHAVHVGDSLEKDVAGATAAGIRAVLIDRGGDHPESTPPSVVRIGTLAELPLVI